MRSKKAGWIVFLGCLLLLGFAATTRYSKTADLAVIGLRLTVLVALSVVMVRELWKRQHGPPVQDVHRQRERGNLLLRRLRCWFYDEQEQRD
ncbi:MAG: hypothetical protein ABSD98_07630 [Candidatus Korobacteraceae bacterium]|jgi:hypothetical protein